MFLARRVVFGTSRVMSKDSDVVFQASCVVFPSVQTSSVMFQTLSARRPGTVRACAAFAGVGIVFVETRRWLAEGSVASSHLRNAASGFMCPITVASSRLS